MASKKVNDLKSRVGDLERQLREAKKRLHDAQCEDAGIAVGDIVLHKGKQHRVTVVESFWSDKPWIRATPMKKDATFGTAERHLCSEWEKV